MLRAAALGGAAAGRVLAALPGHSRLLSAAAAPEQRTALELAMAKTLQESSLGVRQCVAVATPCCPPVASSAR